MAVTTKFVKQQLMIRSVADTEDGKTKNMTTYISKILTAATEQQLYNLAEAYDSITKPTMESCAVVKTSDLISA